MALTFFLAQMFGFMLIILSIALLARKKLMMGVILHAAEDRPVIFMLGILSSAIGLAVIFNYNIWSMGLLPFIITLIGWLFLIRGVLAIFLPGRSIIKLAKWFESPSVYALISLIALILGLYLAYSGMMGSLS